MNLKFVHHTWTTPPLICVCIQCEHPAKKFLSWMYLLACTRCPSKNWLCWKFNWVNRFFNAESSNFAKRTILSACLLCQKIKCMACLNQILKTKTLLAHIGRDFECYLEVLVVMFHILLTHLKALPIGTGFSFFTFDCGRWHVSHKSQQASHNNNSLTRITSLSPNILIDLRIWFN